MTLSGSYSGLNVASCDCFSNISLSKFTFFIWGSPLIFLTSSKLFATFQKLGLWCSWHRPRAWPNWWITRNSCILGSRPFSERTIVGSLWGTVIAWLPTVAQHVPNLPPVPNMNSECRYYILVPSNLTLMSALSALSVFLKIGILGTFFGFQATVQARILSMLSTPYSHFQFSCSRISGLRK